MALEWKFPSESFFYGRKHFFDVVSQIMDLPKRSDRVAKIMGPATSGKTAFAREFAQRRGEYVYVSFKNDLPSPDDFTQLVKERYGLSNRIRGVTVVLDDLDGVPQADLELWRKAVFDWSHTNALLLVSRGTNLPLHAGGILLEGFSDLEVREFFKLAAGIEPPSDLMTRVFREHRAFPLPVLTLGWLLRNRSKDIVFSSLDGSVFQLEESEESNVIRAVRPEIITFSGELVHQLKRAPEMLHDVSPRQFEQLVADLFHDMGWDVELTRATKDGGRDILAHLHTGVHRFLCLIEAKKYRRDRPVGVQLVRQLYGVFCDEQANSAMLVTTSHFSDDAKRFEAKHRYQLSLKEYADVVGWLADYKGQRIQRPPS